MVDLGYETHNEILNLGSVSLFIAFYFFKVVVYLLLSLYQSLTGTKSKVVDKMKKGLFFSELLTLMIEAYFELLISTLL